MSRIAVLLIISIGYLTRIAQCDPDNKLLVNAVEQIKKDVDQLKSKVEYVERTCDEIHWFDPSAKSGKYRVDPDGPMSGADPIEVYCDMDTFPVTTIISHDMDNLIDFSGLDDGSEEQVPNYSAPMRQILALIRQSDQCFQDLQFQYPCEAGASKWKEVLVAEYTWVDRNNKEHPFTHCQKLPQYPVGTCYGACLATSPIETDNLPVIKLKVDEQPKQFDYDTLNDIRLGQLKCLGEKRGPRGPAGPPGPPGPVSLLPSLLSDEPVVTKSPKGAKKSKMSKVSQFTTSSPQNTKQKIRPPKDLPLSNTQKNCPLDIGPNTECYNGTFNEFGCYCFVKVEKTWDKANEFCKSKGMHLLSIDSKKELIGVLFLRPLYLGEKNNWWTSGSTNGGDTCEWPLTGNDCDFRWGGWGRHSAHKSPKPAKLYITNAQSDKGVFPTRLKSGFLWNHNELFSICEY